MHSAAWCPANTQQRYSAAFLGGRRLYCNSRFFPATARSTAAFVHLHHLGATRVVREMRPLVDTSGLHGNFPDTTNDCILRGDKPKVAVVMAQFIDLACMHGSFP